ncbi:MAG: lipid droplet-associated protein [Pseudonocardiaceae bacterium]|nr:lipid droplet-associated protein [Pseudonocardiaceae bacterium]
MNPLPLPFRLAAGLAATAVEQACKLPDQLAGLPVTVVSRAMQASMRVQQQVTELAIRGDEVFAQLRPVDDSAPWARFDEDFDGGLDGAHPAGQRNGSGEVDEADVARALSPDPASLPGYDELSLPQLRGKLRMLSLEQLELLLAHEQRHQDRPAFVTMLSNRINTVRSR